MTVRNWKFHDPMRRILTLLALLLLLAAPAFAETLRYAVFPAPPFIIFNQEDSAGNIRGIDVDIARAVAESMNVRLEFIPCTWARALNLMKNGGADLLSSAFRKPDREVYMSYFDAPSLEQLPVAFYIRSGSNVRIDRFEDLYTVNSVGVLHGAAYFARFDDDPTIRRTVVNTQDQLFEMLLAGRFDCAVGYVPRENYYLSQASFRDQVERSEFVHNEYSPTYMTVSRRSEFMKRFDEMNRIVTQLVENGTVRDITERYFREFALPSPPPWSASLSQPSHAP